jgi:xanthine dehydrogenase small subunit
MRDYLLLYINGQRHEITAERAFQPLSTFLREELGLTGTKIVCAEGDCGSCTVLLGKPNGQAIRYQPVCSCIQYLVQLDATHVITIEGLQYDGQLNPVQQAMVEHHGAQCGFCTPGFVTAMCSVLDEQPAVTTQEMCRGLVGNLCRCTGYGSILEAGQAVEFTKLRSLASLYDTATIAAELAAAERESLHLQTDGQVLAKPATVAEATQFLAQHPQCVIIAGGTDLGVQTNKGKRELSTLLSTRSLNELRGITVTDGIMTVGANTSLAELESAMQQHLPEYAAMLSRFGSPLIKHAGTLGGNIGNGSPIGDTMPGLYVLNAEVELTSPAGSRRANINQFYTGYRQSVRKTDELISRIVIPLPRDGELYRLYKLSKRNDLDISTMTAAIWMRVNPAGDTIEQVRIAYGGVGPIILRLPQTEAFLTGKSFDLNTFRDAGPLARGEIAPISDVRGSDTYRWQLAENLLLKFFYEHTSTNESFVSENGRPSGNVQGGRRHE